MTGFKTETQSGVKSAFSGLAKVAGVALGAGVAFQFAKGAIQGAATLQKSIETINAEFGKAGVNVKKFGEVGATQFGISADLADATSARFGILFKNLGIGQGEAAGMTVGLQKLAGSLSAIRGIDPADVLARLPVALAGNVRALKQLGLGIDSSQIKLAALKLGLISSTKDAITPAIKAESIYALATANLPQFLAQAAAHSNDLANVTRRLSAEWRNAKDSLGGALIPAFAPLIRNLADYLQKANQSGKLTRDLTNLFHETASVVAFIAHGVQLLAGAFRLLVTPIGGTVQALRIFFTLFALNKILSIGAAIQSSIIGRILGLGTATAETAGVAGAATGAIEADFAALIVAVDRLTTVILGRLDPALASIGPVTAESTGIAIAGLDSAAAATVVWAETTGGALIAVKSGFAGVGIAATQGALVSDAAIGGIAGRLAGLRLGLIGLVSKLWVIPLVLSLVPGNKGGQDVLNKIGLGGLGKTPIIGGFAQQVARGFNALFPNHLKIKAPEPSDIIQVTGKKNALNDALIGSLGFGKGPGIHLDPGFRARAKATAKEISDAASKALNAQITANGPVPIKIRMELASATTPIAQKKALKDELDALNRELQSHLTAQNRLAVLQEKQSVVAQLQALGTAASGAAKKTGDSMASLIATANQRITASVEAAKTNLESIGQKLADTIAKIQAKAGGGLTGTSSPVTVAYQKLLALLKGGGAAPEIARATAALQSQIGAKTSAKSQSSLLQDQFHNLVKDFDAGKITFPDFGKKFAAILKKDHVSVAGAGKLLGSTFRDNFAAEVSGFLGQAKALSEVPAKFRRAGGSTAADQIKIIHPLNVIQTETSRIGAAAARQRDRIAKASERSAKANEKNLAIQQAASRVKTGSLPGHETKKNASASKHHLGG